jgi:hypothetical protein
MQYAKVLPQITRRQALRRMGSGFGMVGLAGLLGDSVFQAASIPSSSNPLAVKNTHFPAKAKHVIFLFLNGGLSQVNTFEPKPMLDKYHGQPFPGGNPMTERKTGNLLRCRLDLKSMARAESR